MIGFSNNIVILDMPLYHYVQRNDSIVHSSWTPAVWDLIDAVQSLLDYIDLYYPTIHKAGVNRFFAAANEFYIRAFPESNYIEIFEPVREKLIILWTDIASNSNISLKRKLQYWMLVNTPRLYRRLWLMLKNKSIK